MNTQRDPDAILAAWLEDGPSRLPDATRRAIAVNTRTTHQTRRSQWVPRRFPSSNPASRFALGAVAVVAVALGGLFVFNSTPRDGVGGPEPSASQSGSPSTPPALTQTFTSRRFGVSIDHPAGWIILPATRPWTSGLPGTQEGSRDTISDPTLDDHLFLTLASQPLGDRAGDEWAAAISALPEWGGICVPNETRTMIAGGGPWIIADCDGRPIYALTWAGGRGFVVLLYRSGDEPSLEGTYDRAWFEQVLGTVRLHPVDAVDAPRPSASPDPSPRPS
ncbi:MAG TPA: hypothetical protein VF119_00530 [Candidatus Limnocylindrales bacterium]